MKMSFSVGSLVMILLGSFLGGLVVSVFYNSQYNYINHLAKIDNEEVRYFGINIGFAQSSNVFGSVLSALFITPLGQFNYVLVMVGIILLISLFFLAVKQPPAE
jgi:MFS family permease